LSALLDKCNGIHGAAAGDALPMPDKMDVALLS
jgi:hypothetical protein